MSDKPIEIKIDNNDVERKLLELAQKSENLRPLMKNIAGIFASATEENFKNEGRPDKWTELAEATKKQRTKQSGIISFDSSARLESNRIIYRSYRLRETHYIRQRKC